MILIKKMEPEERLLRHYANMVLKNVYQVT